MRSIGEGGVCVRTAGGRWTRCGAVRAPKMAVRRGGEGAVA
ncbi:MAG: hypothetical protein ABR961_02525 [Thermoanaerobaculaceae bacterium]